MVRAQGHQLEFWQNH